MFRYELNKTAHGAAAEYEVLDAGRSRVGTASYPLRIAWADPIALYFEGASHAMVPDFVRAVAPPVGASMEVSTEGRMRGSVSSATAEEVLRFTPDTVYHASLDGMDYTAYVVGFWRKGRFLCVYRTVAGREVQVAQVDLPTTIDNWLTKNIVHGIDGQAVFAALLLTLYREYAQECHRLEFPSKAKDVRLQLTWNKTLKAKYDPGFLSR